MTSYEISVPLLEALGEVVLSNLNADMAAFVEESSYFPESALQEARAIQGMAERWARNVESRHLRERLLGLASSLAMAADDADERAPSR